MIVDSSALLANLFGVPDRERHLEALAGAAAPRISAVNDVEAAVRVDKGGKPIAGDAFADLVREDAIAVEPVTVERDIWRVARTGLAVAAGAAPAHLSFGDCFAFALAKVTREPLLFKGNNLVHTDAETALMA